MSPSFIPIKDIGCDGTQIRYPYHPKEPEYGYKANHHDQYHGNINVTVLVDCHNDLILNARLSPGTKMKEIASLKEIIESEKLPKNAIILCDRLFENFELIAYFQEYNLDCIIRARDITSKKGISYQIFPNTQGEFDTEVTYNLRHSNKKEYRDDPCHKYINRNILFRFLDHQDVYPLKFRLVRFQVQEADPRKGQEELYHWCDSLDSEKLSDMN